LFHNVVDVVLNEIKWRKISVLQNYSIFKLVWSICSWGGSCCCSIIFTEATNGPLALCQHENGRQKKFERFAETLRLCQALLQLLYLQGPVEHLQRHAPHRSQHSKTLFTDHRQSMFHHRKANRIQLTFEKDLTNKFKDDWKDCFSELSLDDAESTFILRDTFWKHVVSETYLAQVYQDVSTVSF